MAWLRHCRALKRIDHRANRLWGGAGFVLVPHHAGVVSDTVLRAVASYDPDYVVGHRVNWMELLTAYPNAQDMFVDQNGCHPRVLRRLRLGRYGACGEERRH